MPEALPVIDIATAAPAGEAAAVASSQASQSSQSLRTPAAVPAPAQDFHKLLSQAQAPPVNIPGNLAMGARITGNMLPVSGKQVPVDAANTALLAGGPDSQTAPQSMLTNATLEQAVTGSDGDGELPPLEVAVAGNGPTELVDERTVAAHGSTEAASGRVTASGAAAQPRLVLSDVLDWALLRAPAENLPQKSPVVSLGNSQAGPFVAQPTSTPPGGTAIPLQDGLMAQVTEGWAAASTAHTGSLGGTFESSHHTLQSLIPHAGNANATIPIAGGLSPGDAAVASNQASTKLSIELPLTYRGFDGELTNRISWMARQNIHSAEIRLNPPNLGPLEVHVSVLKGETHVLFTSPHAAVREVLEAAIPRLREGFSDQGLVLGEADVADHSAQDRGADRRDSSQMARLPEHALTAAESATGDAPVIVMGINGLLDVYV